MITILDTKQDYERAYERLCVDNRHRALLYSSDASFEVFYNLLSKGWAIETSYDVPSAVAWADTFNGTTAFHHFSGYAGAAHNVTRSTVDILDWFFSMGRTTLFGITPKPYKHVFKAITGPVGYEVVLEEPGMCYMAKYGRHVPGIVTRLTHDKWLQSRGALAQQVKDATRN